MPEIPTPTHVLQALAPVWPPLYTALEWATQQTRAYFEAEGAPIDRHLAPSLVRYQAKRYLARLGHDAQEDEGEAYAFQTLPNNGLSLSYRGDLLYILRILKALEGQLRNSARASTCWCCGRLTRPTPCGGCRWSVRKSEP